MIWNLTVRARRSWQLFKSSKPGDRFQVRYYRRKQSGAGRFSRIINVVVGSILVVVSAFFGWAPGPGIVTLVVGLAMVGGEFLPVARSLDWAEVELRNLGRLAGRIWNTSPLAARTLIGAAILALVAALGYGAYSLLF
jgi:hypothetical protein